MSDIRIEKLADLLVNYSVTIKKGDKVVIQGASVTEPLLKAVYTSVLKAGGHPFLTMSPDGIENIYFRYASDEQLRHVPPPARLVMDTYDARISIVGETNTRELSNIDPARIVMHQQSRSDIMKTFMQRAARGELRWIVAPFPTSAYAQDADMSLSEYEDFLYTACLGNIDDPIGHWQRFSAWQQKIVGWLQGKSNVHVTAPETDLRFSIAGRTFINCDGHQNLPDGEVFTGPVEDSMEGHVYFTYPSIENGREVSGVRLWFEKGVVVKATAEKNEDFLLKMLDTDEGARRVGEFAFGTSEGINHFTKQILFDEKIGGSFHMALGASYPDTGGRNESAIHWDMICDMRKGGQVTVDEEIIYRNGEFLIP